MKPLIFLLAAFTTLAADDTVVEVAHSVSPDKAFRIVVEKTSGGNAYEVKTQAGEFFSPELSSDFGTGHSLTQLGAQTVVIWRSDSAYLVLAEGHDRHHDGFFLMKRTPTGFFPLDLDPDQIWDGAKIEASGFSYVHFKNWLPDDQMEISIERWDGRLNLKTANFVLDLKNQLKVLSWKEIEPKTDIPKPSAKQLSTSAATN